MKLSTLLKNPDVLGWLIWLLLTLALIWPCIHLISSITYEDTISPLTRVLAGVFLAAIGAGVLSWLGNELWFRIRRRRQTAKRKAARKDKRRKK